MPQPIEILVRDVSSGRVHKRFRLEGSTELLSYEADNADEAGEAVPISQEDVDAAPAHLLCRRCFAEDERYRDVPEDDASTPPVDVMDTPY